MIRFALSLESQSQCKLYANVVVEIKGDGHPCAPSRIDTPTPTPMANPFPFPLHVMVNGGGTPCCASACGALVPLSVNGIYYDPNGDGKSLVHFNLLDSPFCGIPVARVLRGDLEGLMERDELAGLNPSAGSMRLRVEVSNPSPISHSHKPTRFESGPATKESPPRSA